MSYEPTTWKSGDVVTSSKLNKIEQGIANAGGGGGLVVTLTIVGGDTTCDKTAGEMATALSNGTHIVFKEADDSGINYYPLAYAFISDDGYTFVFISDLETNRAVALLATSADDYPTVAE